MKIEHMSKWFIVTFVALSVIGLFSCEKDDDESNEKEYVEKTFEVTLESTSGSGFEWVWMNKAEAAADSVSGTEKVEDKVGGTTIHTWTFKTKEEGADSLVLHYMQPWEPDNEENTYVHHFEK